MLYWSYWIRQLVSTPIQINWQKREAKSRIHRERYICASVAAGFVEVAEQWHTTFRACNIDTT